MAVLAVNEVLPRTASHKVGGSPVCGMLFVVTTDGELTTQQEIVDAVGYFHGTPHPEFSYLLCDGVEVTETDRFHSEVSLSFTLSPPSVEEPGQIPWALPDSWSFSTTSIQSACTTHFPNAGNNVLTAPLTNKANDAYEGILKAEPELRASITGYRQVFNAALATQVQSAINSAAYAGGDKHTWQCLGISATPERVVINQSVTDYWQITAELAYRPSTHNLFLPNAGMNYLEGGVQAKKRRCWVLDDEGQQVPSASPMALDNNGDMKQIGAGPYPPDILEFRIFPEIDFNQFFGQPPPTVLT